MLHMVNSFHIIYIYKFIFATRYEVWEHLGCRTTEEGRASSLTYVQHCVATTIEVDGTVRVELSIRVKGSPEVIKIHLADSSYRWKETNFNQRKSVCPGARNWTLFISVALFTAMCFTMSHMYHKHFIIKCLQNELLQWLLTCQQEQQRSRLEHDGAATANYDRQKERNAVALPSHPQ